MQSKALVTLLATLGVAAVSHAQVAFQIAGPQNGATIRETVSIRIPVAALENVKYLALAVDGKFRAGVAVPEKKLKTELVERDDEKKMVTFFWNTKAKVRDPDDMQILDGVDDGPHTIEMIAYDASSKKIGKQTLTLTVNNRGDLRMPAEGISLAYRFAVGEENQYHQRTDLEYVNEVKAPKNTVLTRGGSGYFSQGRGTGGTGMPGGGDSGGMRGPGSFGPGGGSGSMGRGGGSMGRGGGGMMGQGGGSTDSGAMAPGGGGGMGRGGGSMGRGGGGMMGPGMMGQGGGSTDGGGMMGPGMMGQGGGMMGQGGSNPFVSRQPSGPFRIPVQTVKANYKRTTEDRLSSTEYFVRDRVEDGTIIASGGSARLQDIYNFKSRYRAIASSGLVKDPGIANGAHPGAYVALPFIDFGEGKRRIGTKWETKAPLLLEWATLDAPTMVSVQNTLVGLEWESGYQCAKVTQHFDGLADVPIFGGAGKIPKAKVKMDRTIWFSYKAGKVIKMETTTEVDGDTPSDILAIMVPQAGISGGMGGGMMGGGGDLDGGGMMGGGMMGRGSGSMMGGGKQSPGGFGVGGGPGGPMAPGGMGQGGPGFGGMQGGEQQEAPRIPAKFRSVTLVELVAPTVPTPAPTAPPKKK